MKTCILTLAMCLIVTVPAPAQTPQSMTVTVTGRAVGTSEVATEEAKLDALREAVRQVCGAFINAQSQVEDFELVRDKILEQPVGFARVVKITREPKVIGGEITEVQLMAEVFPVQFEQRWAEFAHIKQRAGNPRCVVMMIEDDNVDDDNPPVAKGKVQSVIEDFFLSQKVQLMDKETTDAVRLRDLELAARNKDDTKAAAAGAAFKAEVVVTGKAEAQRGEPTWLGGHKLERWVVTITIRTIQTDSAIVLVSRTYQPAKPYTSSTGTGAAALAKLSAELAPEILADIGDAWREGVTAGKTIQVLFEPCNRRQAKAIQAEMVKLKGVISGEDGFIIREITNDRASVDINWKYNLDQLADRLEELKVEVQGRPIRLEVTDQSTNRLTVKLKAAAPPHTAPGAAPASEPATSPG